MPRVESADHARDEQARKQHEQQLQRKGVHAVLTRSGGGANGTRLQQAPRAELQAAARLAPPVQDLQPYDANGLHHLATHQSKSWELYPLWMTSPRNTTAAGRGRSASICGAALEMHSTGASHTESTPVRHVAQLDAPFRPPQTAPCLVVSVLIRPVQTLNHQHRQPELHLTARTSYRCVANEPTLHVGRYSRYCLPQHAAFWSSPGPGSLRLAGQRRFVAYTGNDTGTAAAVAAT